jgi:hypothetical protein
VVVLVKFEENPSYQCLVRDEDLVALEFPNESDINIEDFEL